MAPPSSYEDPSWLFSLSVFLVIESPHLELNEADLIAVITTIPGRFVHTVFKDLYNRFFILEHANLKVIPYGLGYT